MPAINKETAEKRDRILNAVHNGQQIPEEERDEYRNIRGSIKPLVVLLMDKGYTRSDAMIILRDVFEALGQSLTAGIPVKVANFGMFDISLVKSCEKRRDTQGNIIPDYQKVKFKPLASFKSCIKSGIYENNTFTNNRGSETYANIIDEEEGEF